jgi:hypothetical protein
MDAPNYSTSLGQGTAQGSKYPMDPLVNDEIMLIIRVICAIRDGGGRGKIPIGEGSLNIWDYVVKST